MVSPFFNKSRLVFPDLSTFKLQELTFLYFRKWIIGLYLFISNDILKNQILVRSAANENRKVLTYPLYRANRKKEWFFTPFFRALWRLPSIRILLLQKFIDARISQNPRAERMAVRVVRAMLMMTLHLFLFSLVIVVIFLYFLRDVTVYAKDTSAVDEDLGKDVEDWVVDFAGRWEHEGDECHDDATGKEDDGSPLFEFRFHKFEVKIGSTSDLMLNDGSWARRRMLPPSGACP